MEVFFIERAQVLSRRKFDRANLIKTTKHLLTFLLHFVIQD